jgi:hypothetical protein
MGIAAHDSQWNASNVLLNQPATHARHGILSAQKRSPGVFLLLSDSTQEQGSSHGYLPDAPSPLLSPWPRPSPPSVQNLPGSSRSPPQLPAHQVDASRAPPATAYLTSSRVGWCPPLLLPQTSSRSHIPAARPCELPSLCNQHLQVGHGIFVFPSAQPPQLGTRQAHGSVVPLLSHPGTPSPSGSMVLGGSPPQPTLQPGVFPLLWPFRTAASSISAPLQPWSPSPSAPPWPSASAPPSTRHPSTQHTNQRHDALLYVLRPAMEVVGLQLPSARTPSSLRRVPSPAAPIPQQPPWPSSVARRPSYLLPNADAFPAHQWRSCRWLTASLRGAPPHHRVLAEPTPLATLSSSPFPL